MGVGERRYADHIFIQIYFRMHRFVVKFSKFSSPRAAKGHCPPPNQNPADTFASQLMATHERAASIQHTGAALLQRRKAHFLDRQRKESRLKPISSAR